MKHTDVPTALEFVVEEVGKESQRIRNAGGEALRDGKLKVAKKAIEYAERFAVFEKVFAERFTSKELTVNDESIGVTIIYRDNGESQYVSFELSPESMAISTGGYAQSDAGGDSYGNEVWRLDAYDHADGSCDVVPEALELINMGGEVKADV